MLDDGDRWKDVGYGDSKICSKNSTIKKKIEVWKEIIPSKVRNELESFQNDSLC